MELDTEVYAFLAGLGMTIVGVVAVRWTDRAFSKQGSPPSDFPASLAAAVIAGGAAMSLVSVIIWLIEA